MSALERQLAEDRAVRDSARAVFDARMAEVRRELGERSIPQRAADEAQSRAMSAAGEENEGMAVAEESKWVLVGTGLAILAWLLRGPLIASARKAGDRLFKPEPASPWERLRDWIKSKVTS